MRKLIGFCCLAAALTAGWSIECAALLAESAVTAKNAGPTQVPDANRLVREVVYNELHDHDSHGYWRYWIERQAGRETQVEEQVETPDGPITRLELSNGRPLDAQARESEARRLQRLLSSSSEQAQHRKEYGEDERRIGRIVALLPDAFVYSAVQEQMLPEGLCYHMRFRPNQDYPAHSIEARIFHAMSGDLWISVQGKRLVRLEGKLEDNVDFGFGILGRLYKDGWFRLERTRVAGEAGSGDWKTQRLEIHMNGRAMLFKTIARETSEVRGGFVPVPRGLSLEQAASLMGQTNLAAVRQMRVTAAQ